MGGFFGVASKEDCVFDLFFGTDYHSHLGTRRAAVITCSLALIILLIFLFANNGIENLRQLIPQIQGVWLLAALATAVLTMLLEGLTLHLFCRGL